MHLAGLSKYIYGDFRRMLPAAHSMRTDPACGPPCHAPPFPANSHRQLMQAAQEVETARLMDPEAARSLARAHGIDFTSVLTQLPYFNVAVDACIDYMHVGANIGEQFPCCCAHFLLPIIQVSLTVLCCVYRNRETDRGHRHWQNGRRCVQGDLEAQGLHADWKKGDKLQLPSVIPAARMKVVRSYLASVRLPSLLSLDPSQLFGADSKAGEPGFSRSAILS